MVPRTPRRSIVAIGAGGLALSLALAGCSAGGSDSDDGGASLTFLVDNGEATVATAEALVEAFEAENPDITIEVETQPAGRRGRQPRQDAARDRRDGRRLPVQLGLAVAGAQPRRDARQPRRRGLRRQARRELRRERSRPTTASTASRWASRWRAPSSTTRTSTRSSASRSRPRGTSSSRTARRSRRPARPPRSSRPTATPGPPSCSCSATSTTCSPRTPTGPRSTPNNEAQVRRRAGARRASSTCRRSFEKGLLNEDFASATYDDGVRMVATGEGAHYPMLTFAAGQLIDDEPRGGRRASASSRCPARTPRPTASRCGCRPTRSTSRRRPRATSSRRRRSSSSSSTTPESCDIQTEATAPQGPFVIEGCDAARRRARPGLRHAAVLRRGQDQPRRSSSSRPSRDRPSSRSRSRWARASRSAADGAALYDEDVKKQAQQLGTRGLVTPTAPVDTAGAGPAAARPRSSHHTEMHHDHLRRPQAAPSTTPGALARAGAGQARGA